MTSVQYSGMDIAEQDTVAWIELPLRPLTCGASPGKGSKKGALAAMASNRYAPIEGGG